MEKINVKFARRILIIIKAEGQSMGVRHRQYAHLHKILQA